MKQWSDLDVRRVVAACVFVVSVVLAPAPPAARADGQVGDETSSKEPADPVDESGVGVVDDATVDVGMPPVPPTSDAPVDPVDDFGVGVVDDATVAVGMPPVPPSVEELDVPVVPGDGSEVGVVGAAVVAVGAPPVPPVEELVVDTGSPPPPVVVATTVVAESASEQLDQPSVPAARSGLAAVVDTLADVIGDSL